MHVAVYKCFLWDKYMLPFLSSREVFSRVTCRRHPEGIFRAAWIQVRLDLDLTWSRRNSRRLEENFLVSWRSQLCLGEVNSIVLLVPL